MNHAIYKSFVGLVLTVSFWSALPIIKIFELFFNLVLTAPKED